MGKHINQILRRFTSWALIFLLSLPTPVMALEIPLTAELDPTIQSELTKPFNDGESRELTEQRTASTKVFTDREKGMRAEISLGSLHYQKTGTAWHEIDNTIVPNEQSDQSDFKYTNRANRFLTLFPDSLADNQNIRLQEKDSWLEFKPKLTSSAIGQVKDNTITYPDYANGVDLKYSSLADALKEEIILKDGTTIDFDNPPSFEFDLTLVNAKLKTNEQGQTMITDLSEQKDLWRLAPPVMYDQAQNHSYGIKYEIKDNNRPNSEGKLSYSLTVKITDLPWLGDFERAWPISLDPTIQVLRADAGDQDVHIRENYPSYNFSGKTEYPIGTTDEGDESKALIKFNTNSLVGKNIDSAVLSIYGYQHRDTPSRLEIKNLTGSWTEKNATWQSIQPIIGTTQDTAIGNNSQDWVNFDLTNHLKNNLATNNGYIIGGFNEDYASRYYYSASNSAANYRPKLTVYYNNFTSLLPLGLKPYWTYASQSLGQSAWAGVNVAVGNLVVTQNDLTNEGRGLDTVINRVYNGRDSTGDGPFGHNWTSSVHRRLDPTNTEAIKYRDDTGTIFYFYGSQATSYARAPGLAAKLTYDRVSDTYTLKQSDKTWSSFDSSGKLFAVVDRNQNKLTYQYRGNTLTSIIDPSGREVKFTYSGSRIAKITDHQGNEITYNYDGSDLKTVRYYTGSAEQNQLVSSITYNYNLAHQLTGVVDGRNNTTSFSLDGAGRVTTITDSEGKVTRLNYPSNTTTTLTDPKNQATTYIYNNNPYFQTGVVKKEILPSVNGVNPTTIFDYDADNNRTGTTDSSNRSEIKTFSSEHGGVSHEFDSSKNLTGHYRYSLGDWDQGWNLIERVDGNGTQHLYNFDPAGNLKTSQLTDGRAVNLITNGSFEAESGITPAAGDCEADTAEENPADYWCRWDMAGGGLRYSVDSTTAKIGEKSQKIGWVNNLHSDYDAAIWNKTPDYQTIRGNTAYSFTFSYRDDGHPGLKHAALVKQVDRNNNSLNPTDPKVAKIFIRNNWYIIVPTADTPRKNNWTDAPVFKTFTFTTNPNVAKIVTVMRTTMADKGQTANAWYDGVKLEEGNLATAQLDEQKKTEYFYPTGSTANYGLPMKVKDPKGNETNFTWDNHGNLIANTDPLNKITTFTYDANGNKTAERLPNQQPNGPQFTYEYNGRNQLTAVTNQLGKKTAYQYDANGNLIKTINALGKETLYTYDKTNRSTTETDQFGVQSNLTYDANGNPEKIIDPNSKQSALTYDATDRLTKELNSVGLTTNYQYDVNHNLTQITGQQNLTYTYNNAYQLTSETNNNSGTNKSINFEYDKNGNEKKVTTQANEVLETTLNQTSSTITHKRTVGGVTFSTAYTRDLNNNLTKLAKHNNDNTDAIFDAANRIKELKTTNGANIRSWLAYEYDDNGNRNRIIDKSQSPERSTSYQYDSLNQLIKITKTNGESEAYSYDEVGNRLAKIVTPAGGQGQTTSYTYAGNRLIRATAPDGKVTQFGYDNNGNLTNKQIAGQTNYLAHFNGNSINSRDNNSGNSNGTLAYQNAKFGQGLLVEEPTTNLVPNPSLTGHSPTMYLNRDNNSYGGNIVTIDDFNQVNDWSGSPTANPNNKEAPYSMSSEGTNGWKTHEKNYSAGQNWSGKTQLKLWLKASVAVNNSSNLVNFRLINSAGKTLTSQSVSGVQPNQWIYKSFDLSKINLNNVKKVQILHHLKRGATIQFDLMQLVSASNSTGGEWAENNGVWTQQIENNNPIYGGDSSGGINFMTGRPVNDVVLSTKFKRLDGDVVTGLALRGQDNANSYVAFYHYDAKKFYFGKIVNGQWTQLAISDTVNLTTNTWYYLKAQAAGNEFRVSWSNNGRDYYQTIFYNEPTLTFDSGLVGYYLASRSVFDDFRIDRWSANGWADYGNGYTSNNAENYASDWSARVVAKDAPAGGFRNLSLKPHTTYTLSLWIKIKRYNAGEIRLYRDGFGISDSYARADLTKIGEWQRLSTTFTTSGATTGNIYFMGINNPNLDFYADALQLEEKAYATSYADGSLGVGYAWTGAANASASTRAGGNFTTQGFSNFEREAGTLELWLKTLDWGNDNLEHIFLTIKKDDNNFVQIKKTAGNQLQFIYRNNGIDYGATSNGQSWQKNSLYHLASSWSPNGTKLYLNGLEVGSSANFTALTVYPDKLYFGPGDSAVGQNSGGQANAVIDEVRLVSRVLTTSEIATDAKATTEFKIDDNTIYEYDSDDYLTKVTKSDGTLVSYTYDPQKRLIKRVQGSSTIQYQYDGAMITTELDGAGATLATYTYDQDGDLLSMRRAGSDYYFIRNAHDDIVALTNSLGTVQNTYTYDEWGKDTGKSETVTNPFRYASYWYDDTVGLYHLGARWYESELGRFSSVDPHPGDQDDPISLNEYLYTANNPVNAVDPDGDYVETALDIASVVYSAQQFKKQRSFTNGAWLAFDVVMLALPIGTGSGVIRAGLKGGGKVAAKGVGKISRPIAKISKAVPPRKLSFSQLINDIKANPNDYEKVASLAEKATARQYRGGISIQDIFVNKKTGQRIVQHSIYKNGRIIDQHYRPKAK